MNSSQAKTFNANYPFTVAACDDRKAFVPASFATRDEARAYATAQRGKPWVIACSSSGAVVEVG